MDRLYTPAVLVALLCAAPVGAQQWITGSTGSSGERLRLQPGERTSLRQVIGDREVTAGPLTLDGRTGTVRVDVRRVAVELRANSGSVEVDLFFAGVGSRYDGFDNVTWIRVGLSDDVALRLDMAGKRAAGLITTGSVYEDGPPHTPWRLVLEGGREERVIASGLGGAEESTGLGAFALTRSTYHMRSDLEAVCVGEFGGGFRVADWNDVVEAYRQGAPPDEILRSGTGMVTRNGNGFFSQTRHYFVSRHDHQKPPNYLAHATIDRHLFDLGSWYSERRVLCYREHVW